MKSLQSCSLVASFSGEHVPVTPKSETVSEVLSHYTGGVMLQAGHPPSLLKSSPSFIGYDGHVVPIEFHIFSFFCLNPGIKGCKIIQEMEERGTRQATCYERALLVRTPGFIDLVKERESRCIHQTMALAVADEWKNRYGSWTGCVDVKDGKFSFRYFFAGESSPLNHSFPIGGEEYLIVGVRK